MKKNVLKTRYLLLGVFVVQLFSINSLLAQKHSATSAHTTYTGHSMTGYQGWFGTPGDGGTNNWRHYKSSNGFKPGSASIEYWPDMREADEDEKYLTSFVKNEGSPAYVFSSVHPKTVSRHFQWMKEYGIDGAFMQRFRSDFGILPTMNIILGNALNAAREHGRAISLMYDIGANIHINGVPDDALRTTEVNMIFNDWKGLVDNLDLTTGGDDQPYLYHNGKPLIVLWGVGFNHRHNSTGLDVQYWVELVDSLQNSPEYGGCAVMLGVPTYWRTGGNDCISGSEHTKMLELIKTVDIVQPWHTSRYSRSQMSIEFKNIVTSDIVWCTANGIDYTPTVSPGIREKILHGNNYEKKREAGYYFWDMAKAAIQAGSQMLYLGMFDEVDEGTQYHKIDNDPPFYSNTLSFATYGNDPEDHYLWLAGEATRALRGEFTMGSSFRARADDTDFQSEITFSDSATYEMRLSTPAPGSKVFYANPYKVADGAPTVGTVRNAELFADELTSEAVIFADEQRGLYIRFVEVDAATDEVIAYKAVIALVGFASLPYATGFEDGEIDPKYWTLTTSDSSGKIRVNDEHEPKTGNYHLTFDTSFSTEYSTNSADLHLNLKGIITDLILDFSLKMFSEEVRTEDGIYFSNDAGITFTKVYDFQGTANVYNDLSLNINELAQAAGLSFTDKFVIRFQHSDAEPIPSGGIALDDINISYSDAKSGFGQFFERDADTQGQWIGKYGIDGHYIVEKTINLPAYANLSWDPNSKAVVWQGNSTDARGLQFTPDSTILSAFYAEAENYPWWFSVDVGEQESNVSVYFLDGDNQNRRFILNVIDNATGDKYDIQTIQNFEDGLWLTWRIRGKVKFVMEFLEGPGAVVSGIFFDPYSPSEIVVENFLTFDGQNDFVDCGINESLQISGNEITLEAWFKINNTKSATYQSTILAMDHSESGNDVGYFMRANGNGQIEWGFGDGKWHEVNSEDGIQLFELDTWNHVAGVYDGSTQDIYLNGNLVASKDSVFTEISPTPSEPLYIGSTPSFSNRVIDAGLAEVRIWNIARSAGEIKEFATKRITGSETGLAAYWPIDEGEGQVIADISPNNNNGILGRTTPESDSDPVWTKGELPVSLIDILADYNGSFEDNLTHWRFFEVPNSLGSTAEIIQGDVVHGAKAVKITYVEPDESLADRALDNWDSNMPLEPGAEYLAEFRAKTDSAGTGKLKVTYGFFDTGRQVISEADVSFALSGEYQKYEFGFTAPAGTAKGWLSFRWKEASEDKFVPGVIYLDHVQLWTEDMTVHVEDLVAAIPAKFELEQNYPNPFNPSTSIRFSIPQSSYVKLSVYNIVGQAVATLVDGVRTAGQHTVTWEAGSLSSGIYIYRMEAGSTVVTRKMTLLK